MGLCSNGELFHRIVVDPTGTLVELIPHGMIENAGRIDRRAVRQMAAVRQIEPHERIAGLEHREKYGHIGLSARMRLHVGILGSVELAQAVDSQLLDPIDDLAAAVITRSGYPSAYLLVSTEPMACMTCSLTKFSEAISSMPCICRRLFAFDQIE